jgi:uncharacterized protein YdeI (YjbR/CyaY-like superfamily)
MQLVMGKTSPEVDAYIAKAAAFAQPILRKVRAAFHKGCPDLEERIKWGAPSFEYKGLMGGMAAFKKHVAWGFWRQSEMADPHHIFQDEGMMGGGKITDVAQLPAEKVIVEYVKAAARLNDAGPRKRAAATLKPPVKVPPDFKEALRSSPKALATFEGFPPSHRREYVEWITEAKQEATRERRIATAIEWLAQGKSRNWKYERC